MALEFQVSSAFDDLQRSLKRNVFQDQDFVAGMKNASKPLISDLERNTPNSRGAYRAARRTRAKYGTLKQVGVKAYVARHRRNKALGVHAINVGYHTRNGKKAFVASFLNYGARSIFHGMRFHKTRHAGWLQKAESRNLNEVNERFGEYMQNKFSKRLAVIQGTVRMRKVL